MKRQYDVLSVADHFVMITTVIMDDEPDDEVIKKAAWKRMSDEYGDIWVAQTKKLINRTSIEPALMDWADADDDSDIYTVADVTHNEGYVNIPSIGDATDAGIAGE